MQHVLDLIQQHGDLFYLITFIWTALEGETFVIFAGLAAHRDFLRLDMLFFCAALGSMFGDQCCFFLGRFFGRRVVTRYPSLQPKLERIFGFLEKNDTTFILSYRFMYGVRNVSALAIGMSQITWHRFTALNACASFLWAFVFVGAGFLFGDVMQRLGIADEETVNFEVRGFMIAVLSLFVLIIGIRYLMARRSGKLFAKADEAEKGDKAA